MIKLISTDFDGTLVDHETTPSIDPELFSTFQSLKDQGVLWAVNTGRAVRHVVEGLEEFRFPFHPDFVLTSEREVFRRSEDGEGWEDFGDWNRRCTLAHAELFAEAGPVFDRIREYLESETEATLIHEEESPVGVIASDDHEMDRIVGFIEKAGADRPEFHYQRNTIYLRFCHRDYHKGAALGELSRLLGIDRESVFAAGDHQNDLSMLDGQFAACTACPSNSTEEVKATVRSAGGYVATRRASSGVLEALRHYGATA
jgi:HAD superfamily hydrolase (TIGR01484 family)